MSHNLNWADIDLPPINLWSVPFMPIKPKAIDENNHRFDVVRAKERQVIFKDLLTKRAKL